jgi:hypothetical protein
MATTTNGTHLREFIVDRLFLSGIRMRLLLNGVKIKPKADCEWERLGKQTCKRRTDTTRGVPLRMAGAPAVAVWF